jgi:hypothetical protein
MELQKRNGEQRRDAEVTMKRDSEDTDEIRETDSQADRRLAINKERNTEKRLQERQCETLRRLVGQGQGRENREAASRLRNLQPSSFKTARFLS